MIIKSVILKIEFIICVQLCTCWCISQTFFPHVKTTRKILESHFFPVDVDRAGRLEIYFTNFDLLVVIANILERAKFS